MGRKLKDLAWHLLANGIALLRELGAAHVVNDGLSDEAEAGKRPPRDTKVARRD